jgi:glycosyltransferase involved in cell wall biosynthesis
LLLGDKIKAAEFVACASYFGRAQAMRLVQPDHWRKLHVIRCGLAPDELPRPARGREKLRIVCVGRLSAEKGQAGLLQAFAHVAADNEHAELIFIGDGPEGESLQADAKALGISSKVTFAGRKSEPETLEEIALSDILVLPSFMEGLPVVLMEAMAIGVPVVASRVAGIPELVEDRKTGLLFTPSDWNALADCLTQLVADASLRVMLASSAQSAIFPDFDSKTSARRMEELFAHRAETSSCSEGLQKP